MSSPRPSLYRKGSENGYSVSTLELGSGPVDTNIGVPILEGTTLDGSEQDVPLADLKCAQKWNYPRINMWRVLSTFFCMFVMGLNDAVYGAIIPYLESSYSIDYTTVSMVFLAPVCGYIGSSFLIGSIHKHLGQRGVAILGPLSHMIAYSVVIFHPPFPVLVVAFIIAAFGCGVMDGAWNAWISDLPAATQLLGFLHGFYGLGGVLSPLGATAMITKLHYKWYSFYYIMIGFAAIELFVSLLSFRHANGEKYRAENIRSQSSCSKRSVGTQSPIIRAIRRPATTICAGFLFVYIGIEVALGGWITTYMLKVRDGSAFNSGLASTGFWLGITLGRMLLGFVTPLLGLRISVILYLLASIALETVFWLIDNFVVSAVAAAFIGFFLGPLFPAGILAATERLPKDLHVIGVGYIAALASGGSCIFPFAVGIIANSRGVWVLQPIILGLMGGCLVIWFLVPRKGSSV